MKCPYRIMTVHKDRRGIVDGVNDRQDFCECYRVQCPFYIKEDDEKCRRVEAEVKGDKAE